MSMLLASFLPFHVDDLIRKMNESLKLSITAMGATRIRRAGIGFISLESGSGEK